MTSGAGFGIGTHPGLDCRAWPDSLPAELTEWLCRSSAKRQHLAASLGALQKICPVLHHLGPWLQIEGVVVGGADGIPGSVSKLQLDMVMAVSLLVKDSGRQPTESVARSSGLCNPCASTPAELCCCSSACRG